MSVIVWDGTTLAADKQVTFDGSKGAVTKIFRVPQGLVGFVGDASRAMEMLHWFKFQNADPAQLPSFQKDNDTYVGVVLIDHESEIWKYEYTAHPYQIEDKFFAMGAGRDYALAAMECGKTAIEAVLIASKFNNSCGMGFTALDLIPAITSDYDPTAGLELSTF